MKKPKDNVDFILFAIKQAKEAETAGFSRNECCRNLKTALHQYWQNKELGLHGQAHKKDIPRSKNARNKPLSALQVEHVVPLMWFVNEFIKMNPLKKHKVEKILKTHFKVLLVTKKEHDQLNASGARSTMPDDWNGKNIWARYEKVGIEPDI